MLLPGFNNFRSEKQLMLLPPILRFQLKIARKLPATFVSMMVCMSFFKNLQMTFKLLLHFIVMMMATFSGNLKKANLVQLLALMNLVMRQVVVTKCSFPSCVWHRSVAFLLLFPLVFVWSAFFQPFPYFSLPSPLSRVFV